MSFRILGPKGRLIVRAASAARVKALLPALRRRFAPGKIKVRENTPSPRDRIVYWARWGVRNTAAIHYTEDGRRGGWINEKYAAHLPLWTDCSGFATFCYHQAGLPDPNGLGYKRLGYTGTLLDHARHVSTDVRTALPGDLIVYGPGTGAHVAVIVEAGTDPLTVSHGQESEPAYVRVSQDGRRPQRICRYL